MVDVLKFFESRLAKYGDNSRTLGWSPEGQRTRFEVLTEVGDFSGREILDLGCGLGHLYNFVRRQVGDVTYAGVDISPKLIASARKIHPGVRFISTDATSGRLPLEADYVVASGVLNLETGTNEADMRKLIRGAYRACREATAINMLSTWADWTEEGRHYYDPIRMLRFARRVTPRVVLRHDYMPHDFTLYLYRRPIS